MLKVKNLTQLYGPHKAIDNLEFQIKPGTIAGFLGPNGAGKSTTMNIVCGAALGYEGEVWVDNINLRSHPVEAKKKIGYLPENPPLYDDMQVREYLEFVAQLKNIEPKNIKDSVDEILSSLTIEDVQFRPIHKLSKGYRQRVALAQAFVSKPELIVLDEPTVGLDPQQINEFRKLIVKCKGRSTILWSTHILADVESTCDEIIVISKGKILASGPQSLLREKIKGKSSARVFVKASSLDFEKAVSKMHGIINIEWHENEDVYRIEYAEPASMDQILKLAVQNDLHITKMDQNSVDLEGLFLELTKPQQEKI
ncbi:MAG: ABC transporter ATP-binding protein [Bdellovibrionaceae bacterium]|nr:ABC transporter ATP-binding protein [Pseudobdellovibrionaceae bacterium]